MFRFSASPTPARRNSRHGFARFFPRNPLSRVFFSDDGSTALECALKMAVQFRLQTGEPERNHFIAFSNGYHGDTLGAASLGGVGRFFERFKGRGYPVTHVRSLDEIRAISPETIAAVVIEPLIQGVNEMRPWPGGMLAESPRLVRCRRRPSHPR